MNDITALVQNVPWAAVGAALVGLNVVLLALRLTRRLLILAIGAALIAVGIANGIIPVL